MAPSDYAAEKADPAVTEPPPNMMAHISMRGDVPGRAGEWLGEPGSSFAIEAIMLAQAGSGPPHLNPAPEYQLLLSDTLMTPWTAAGMVCGSRGLGLAARGIRFRLSAETAAFFDCTYDVAFTDGSVRERVPTTEMARAPAGAALAAFRLNISQRPGVPLIVLNDIDTKRPIPGPDPDRPNDPTLRLRFLSPAFASKAPPIRNGSEIPPEFWGAMNLSFSRGVFPSRVLTLRHIEEATIAGPGIVFDRNLDLVPITDLNMPPESIAYWRQRAEQAPSEQIRRIEGLSLFCRTQAPANYGHFLIEAFAKAWIGQQLLAQRTPTFLIQHTRLHALAEEAFGAIGINRFAIAATGEEPLRCSALLVMDGLTNHGIYQSPLCAAALRALGEPVPAAAARKLFVRRQGGDRPLLNQAEIEDRLRARGFEVVEPGSLSLTDQIALFKGAETVVGPLGAALTNIAFCAPGARVVALTAQSFPDTFFWFLAQTCGLAYEEIRGANANREVEKSGSWNAGFTLDESDIAYLESI